MLVSPCRFARRFRVLKHLESWPLRSKKNRKKHEGASLKSCGRSMVPCTPEKEKHPFWVSGAILISTSLLQIDVLVESFPPRLTFWGHFFVAWMTLISLISLLGVGVRASGLAGRPKSPAALHRWLRRVLVVVALVHHI